MTDSAVAAGTTKAATSINHEPCSSLRSGWGGRLPSEWVAGFVGIRSECAGRGKAAPKGQDRGADVVA
jgi:hypothetical protein